CPLLPEDEVRSVNHADAVQRLLKARRAGNTLRWSAALAGVHVSTVCRWQARDPALREALAEADREAKERRSGEPRPSVPWHRHCPLCKAKVVVRTTRGGARFSRCGTHPPR